MALNSANFEFHIRTQSLPITDSNTGILWKYTTTDNLANIGSHYFDAEGYRVRQYDWITVHAADKQAIFYVMDASQNPANDGVTVTISNPFMEATSFTGGYFTF